MSKTYIDMEELETLFARYGISYTNIFDEMRHISPEEVAEEMTVHELSSVLESKNEVFAVQVWQKDDIVAATYDEQERRSSMRYKELVDKIAQRAKRVIEDCSDNWDKLYQIIEDVKAEE